MKTSPFLLHALSPLHAGTGHAADVIDLPIARMKATGIPIVPGSSIKGVLRDARFEKDRPKTEAVFGPPAANASDYGGALVVGDARLLALPVRSFRGTFAWTTSPLLLALAKRDLEGMGGSQLAVPSLEGRGALVGKGNVCIHEKKLYLEDLDLSANESKDVDQWAQWLAPVVFGGKDIFTKRFVVVDDDTMTFLWETATQVDVRIRLEPTTRTVADGALWTEESLPPESLLIGSLAADRSRRPDVSMTPEDVLQFALEKEEIHQIGGHATIGRGRCRVIPVRKQSGGES